MSDSNDDLGGSPVLPVLLVGRGPVLELLARPGDDGLARAVSSATGGSVSLEVTIRDAEAGQTLLGSLVDLAPIAADHPVTVLVLEGDLPDRWPPDLETAEQLLFDGVRALKAVGTRIIAVGVSTVDPSGPSDEATTRERVAHELSLALLEASVGEGISVLDTDRIVAEVGAGEHVQVYLRYDALVHELLVSAMVEILADYGFFEARPLVPQVGVNNR